MTSRFVFSGLECLDSSHHLYEEVSLKYLLDFQNFHLYFLIVIAALNNQENFCNHISLIFIIFVTNSDKYRNMECNYRVNVQLKIRIRAKTFSFVKKSTMRIKIKFK